MSLTRTIIFFIAGLFLILVIKGPLTNALSLGNGSINLTGTNLKNSSNRNIIFKTGDDLRKSLDAKDDLLNSTSPLEQLSSSTDQNETISRIGDFIFNKPESTSQLVQTPKLKVLKRHRRLAAVEEESQCRHDETTNVDVAGARETVKRCSGKRKKQSRVAKKYRSKSESQSNSMDETAISSPQSRKKNKKNNRKMAKKKRPPGKKKPNDDRKKKYQKKKEWLKKQISNRKSAKKMKGSSKNDLKSKNSKGNRLKKHDMHIQENEERTDNVHPKLHKINHMKSHDIVPRFRGASKSKNKHIGTNSLNGHGQNKGVTIHKIKPGTKPLYNKRRKKPHNFQKTKRGTEEIVNSTVTSTSIKTPTQRSADNQSEVNSLNGSVKPTDHTVQSVSQTGKPLEANVTKRSALLRRGFLQKLKHKIKAGLQSSHLAKKRRSKVNDTVQLRFLNSLSRSIRHSNTDVLNDVKDFLQKNFRTSNHKRAREIDSRGSKPNEGILDQVKEFLVNNFHPDRSKRGTTEITNQPDSDPDQSSSTVDADLDSKPEENDTSIGYGADMDEDEGEVEEGVGTANDKRNLNSASKERSDDVDEDNTSANSDSPTSSEAYTSDESLNDGEGNEKTSESTASLKPVTENSLHSDILKDKELKNYKRDVENSSEVSQNGDTSSSQPIEMHGTNASKKSKKHIRKEIISSSTHFPPTSNAGLNEKPASSSARIDSTSSGGLNHTITPEAILESKSKLKVSREAMKEVSDDYDDGQTFTESTAPTTEQQTEETNPEYHDRESASSTDENEDEIKPTERNQRKINKSDEYGDDLPSKDEYSPVLLKADHRDKSTDSSDPGEHSEDSLEPNNSKISKSIEIHKKYKHSPLKGNADDYEDNIEPSNSITSTSSDISSKYLKRHMDSKADRKLANSPDLDENNEDYDAKEEESSNSKIPKSIETDSEESQVNSNADSGKSKHLSDFDEKDYDSEDTVESNNSKIPKKIKKDNRDEKLPESLKTEKIKSNNSPDLVKNEDYESEEMQESSNSKIPRAIKTDSEDPHGNLKAGDRKSKHPPKADENDDYDSENTIQSSNSEISNTSEIDSKDENSPVSLKTEKRISKNSPDLSKNDDDYEFDVSLGSSNSKIPKMEIDSEEILSKIENSKLKPDLESSNSKIPKMEIDSEEILSKIEDSKLKPDLDKNADGDNVSEGTVEATSTEITNTSSKFNRDGNSPVNSKEDKIKSPDSADSDKSFEDYDYEGTLESSNHKKPKAIKEANKNKNILLSSDANRRKSTDSAELDESEEDYDSEDTLESKSNKISKAIEKNKSADSKIDRRKSTHSPDLNENHDYDSEESENSIEKSSTHKSESEVSEISLQRDADEENPNESSTLDTSNEYDDQSDVAPKSSVTAESHKLARYQKSKKPKTYKNKRLNDILKHKISSSSDVGNLKETDDNDISGPETDLDSDKSAVAVRNKDQSEKMVESDYEVSDKETSNNEESDLENVRTNAARSPNKNIEKLLNFLNSQSHESSDNKTSMEGEEDDNSNSAFATTTFSNSESKDSKDILESRDTGSREQYEKAKDSEGEYDYEVSEIKLINPRSNSILNPASTGNETTSTDISKILIKKDVPKDDKNEPGEDVSASSRDGAEKDDEGKESSSSSHDAEKDDEGNESASLNMVKAHQGDDDELATKSGKNSSTDSDSIDEESISSDSMSDDSKADSDSEGNVEKVKNIDTPKKEAEGKIKLEKELLDSMDAISTSDRESKPLNDVAPESMSDGLEKNVDEDKGSDEEIIVSKPEPEAFKFQRSSEQHHSGRIKNRRGEDKATSLQILKKFLNSLIHTKIQERRNKDLESKIPRRIRRTRDTLNVEPTTFPEVTTMLGTSQSSSTLFKRGWLFGLSGLVVIMSSIVIVLYKLAFKRSREKTIYGEALNSDDLKDVFVKDDDRTSDLTLSGDDDDAEMSNRWDNDDRHLQNVINRVLQNSEIPENETIKNKYSDDGHTSKIHLAMSGTLE